MSAPLPWRPPVIGAVERRLAAWADGACWPSDGPLGVVRWRRAASESSAAIAALVGEPSSVALTVTARDGGGAAIAVAPWALVAALVRAALGTPRAEPDELPAPRPPTAVERALVAAAIADALVRADVAADVGLGRPLPPAGPSAVAHLSVSRPCAAELAVVVPALPPPRVRSLAELLPTRAHRLPPIRARVELARGGLSASASARLAALAPADVIVVGSRAPALRIARGRVAGALDLAAGELTVAGSYLRTAAMNDDLADDLSIPLTIVAGEVALSARALLELAPGSVLPLGRPLAGAVELWAGGRRIARGELVEVDGALGVRVAELLDDPSRAAASASVRDSSPRGE